MSRTRPGLTGPWSLGLGLLLALVLAGCGGSGNGSAAGPAHVQTTASSLQGPILLEHISYTTFDGSRVPALFSIPRAYPARGCLIWEGAFGSTKRSAATLGGPLARLGLAVFSIDLRDHGQRATGPAQLANAVSSAGGVSALVTDSVKDLERAVDYLWTQPSCRHNLAYGGIGLGGIIGSILAAQDRRIGAAILVSVPPNWRQFITTGATAFLRGIAGQPARLNVALQRLSPLDPERWLGRISPRPLLFLFASHDPLIPPAAARRTVAAAGEPKTVIYYDGAATPLGGSAAAGTVNPVEIFLLKYVVEPTYPLPRPTLPRLP